MSLGRFSQQFCSSTCLFTAKCVLERLPLNVQTSLNSIPDMSLRAAKGFLYSAGSSTERHGWGFNFVMVRSSQPTKGKMIRCARQRCVKHFGCCSTTNHFLYKTRGVYIHPSNDSQQKIGRQILLYTLETLHDLIFMGTGQHLSSYYDVFCFRPVALWSKSQCRTRVGTLSPVSLERVQFRKSVGTENLDDNIKC